MALEVGHNRLTKLHVAHSMHERTAVMAYLSDAFVAMPGNTILEGEVARSLDPRFA